MDLINAPWPCIDNFQDVNRALAAWTKVFLSIVDKHAPCRTRRIRNKPSPWLNPNIKQLMFKRDWLKKKATKTGMLEDWMAYKASRNLCNKEIRLAKKRFYQSRINEASGDQKATWKVLNDLLGKKSCATKINELKSDCGVTITNPEDIADYMNKHFAAIGPNLASKNQVNEDNITPTEFLTKRDSSFNLKKVEASSVLKLLNGVKINKATGIDKISNRILKLAAPVIYKNLTDLFNLSITSGVFPSDWKIAKVSPLFKSGDLTDANNYRPISVLPTIARVFERLIFDQLYTYVNENNFLYTYQSGFRPLHSTLTALLDITNEWCFNIDKGMVNGVLFLDLKKAFDTVDHVILLTKLRYYGVETDTINWFTSYLQNRQQVCYANGITSSIDYITCGVPQGSILGPLLFLIYINDISKCLDYGVARLFADDTNLTFSGCSFPALQNKMSKDLKGIASWLSANRLTLNVLKTDFMVIGSRQRVASLEEDIALSLLGTELEKVNSVKCLGVDIDEYLTWDNHMLSIRKKVTRNLGVLRRVKPFLKTENLIVIYRSIIEPYFTYCCIVWDSISETQIANLQKLQNRAARIITGASYLQRSSDVLCELGWMTLEAMRKRQKAILMFKILNGLTPPYLSQMFTHSASFHVYGLRSSRMNLALPKSRTDFYRNSFSFTGAKIWNELPNSLKEETSLKRFMGKLDHYYQHQQN